MSDFTDRDFADFVNEREALRARIAELEEQTRLLRHAGANDHRLVHERNARLALAEAAREDVRTLFRALHREPDGMWIFSGSAEVFELDKAMDRLAAWRAQK